jgi:hypothetical protein
MGITLMAAMLATRLPPIRRCWRANGEMPRHQQRAYMCTSTPRATVAAHAGALPTQYRLRLLSGACLRRATRCSRAGEPEQRLLPAPPQLAGPCWYKPAMPAVLAVIHACADRLSGSGAARDGGRSGPNGRAARNHLRGPPPKRAWPQHAGPAPLHAQEGAVKPLYHCPAPRRNLAQLATAGAGAAAGELRPRVT